MMSVTIFCVLTRHVKSCLSLSLCMKTKINLVIAKIFLNTQSEMMIGMVIVIVTLVMVVCDVHEDVADGSEDEGDGEEGNAKFL